MNSSPVASASGPERYGTVTQSIHWVTALLVVAAFAYGPGGSERSAYRPSGAVPSAPTVHGAPAAQRLSAPIMVAG